MQALSHFRKEDDFCWGNILARKGSLFVLPTETLEKGAKHNQTQDWDSLTIGVSQNYKV